MNQKKKWALAMVILLLPVFAMAQQNYSLELTDVIIRTKGQEYALSNPIMAELVDGNPEMVSVFNQDGINYLVNFRVGRSGNRLKLIYQGTLGVAGQGRHVGKKKKKVQFLNVSVPGAINGKAGENFLYDRRNFGAFSVSYNYKLTYL